MAGGDEMNVRVPAVVVRRADREREQVVDQRVHLAELAPELVRRRAVPVDLKSKLCRSVGVCWTPIVVGQAARARALDVRQRVQRQQASRDRIDPAGGDDVVGELLAAVPGGQVAGERDRRCAARVPLVFSALLKSPLRSAAFGTL